MLLLKVLLKEVTDDESLLPIFEMGEGCNDIDDVIESMYIFVTQLEKFSKRKMGYGT